MAVSVQTIKVSTAGSHLRIELPAATIEADDAEAAHRPDQSPRPDRPLTR